MRLLFPLTAGMLLLAGTAAVGQDQTRRGSLQREQAAPAQAGTGLIGATVSLRGRDLGRVRDLTLGDNGAIEYLLVGNGDGILPVPFSAVRYDRNDRAFTVTSPVSFRDLEGARFPTTQRPDLRGDRWIRMARLLWGDRAPDAAPAEPALTGRIEREPPTPQVTRQAYQPPPYDAAEVRRLDMAAAARLYAEPGSSVAFTRNIDRLPRYSRPYDNYTLPYEMRQRIPIDRIVIPPRPIDSIRGASFTSGDLP